MIGYAFSQAFLAHDPPATTLTVGGRPFALGPENVSNAGLTARTHDLVGRSGLLRAMRPLAFEAAAEDELAALHDDDYLARLAATAEGGPWDADFAPVTAGTWGAARMVAGAAIAAARAVMAGTVARAVVLARPAGHHAERDRAMGSTFLNNGGLAAQAALDAGAERVLLLDWDVHIGNGAERLFWERDDVLALSLHQHGWYPAHAGDPSSTGGRGGAGATVNVALPPATTDAGYLLALEEVVVPVTRAYRPDLIVLAAGQDPSIWDPCGRMCVSAAGFHALAARVAGLADELCGGRVVVCTEGGYSHLYTPFCALAVLEGVAGRRTAVEDPFAGDPELRAAAMPADDRVAAALRVTRAAHERWFPRP